MKIPKPAFKSSTYLQKIILGVLIILWLISFIIFSAQKIWTYDVWWHLATGKLIWTKGIPHTDPFSYTFQGKPWVDAMWLFQAIAYKAYETAGYAGVVALKIFILALTFLFLWFAFKESGVDHLVSLTFLFLVLIGSSYRFMCRPHICGFLFITIFWWRLLVFKKKKTLKSLWPLFLSFIIWINCHGSFIIGLILVGIFFLEEILKHREKTIKEAFKGKYFKNLFLTLLILSTFTLINPYGIKLLKFVLFSHRGNNSEALSYIGEWHPTNIKEMVSFIWDKSLFIKIIFWMSIICILLNSLKIENSVWIIFLVILSYLSFKHSRFWALFTLSISPLIVQILNQYNFQKLKNYLCSVLISISILFIVFYISNPKNYKNIGLGVQWNRYPRGTINLVKKEHLLGPIFNTYAYGGFIIWNLFPKHKVFIDGRTPSVYSIEFYWKYRLMSNGNELAIKKLLSKYRFKTFLTSSKKLASKLKNNFNFSLIGFDDQLYLLIDRKNLKTDLRELKIFDPQKTLEEMIKENKELGELKDELLYTIKNIGPSAKALNYLGVIYADYYKSPNEGIKYFQKATKIKPYDDNILFNIGLNYERLNELKKAKYYLKKCIKINKKHKKAWLILGEIYYKQKKYKKALKCFLKHKKINGDNTSIEAYNYLALTYNQLYQLDNALKYFKRCLFLSKSKEQKKIYLYNIGSCYLAMKKYQKSVEYLEKSLKIDPHFEKALKALKEAKILAQKDKTQ